MERRKREAIEKERAEKTINLSISKLQMESPRGSLAYILEEQVEELRGGRLCDSSAPYHRMAIVAFLPICLSNSLQIKCPALVRYIPCGREAVAGSIVCKDILFPRNNQINSQKTKKKPFLYSKSSLETAFLYEIVSKLLDYQTS